MPPPVTEIGRANVSQSKMNGSQTIASYCSVRSNSTPVRLEK